MGEGTAGKGEQKMLLIDGVKYEPWTPPSESDFEQVVKEHAEDIFGENACYFDLKRKLKTGAGVGSIPDAYVVVFDQIPCWYIVEVELSSHPLYEHIVPQITKFVNGIQNPLSQNQIVNAIDDEIASNPILAAWVRARIQDVERHKFLSGLITMSPTLVIVINKATPELTEVCDIVSKSLQTKVVEFRTFAREGCGLSVHAHLFEPLYSVVAPTHTIVSERPKSSPATIEIIRQGSLEVIVRTPTCINYHLFYIPKPSRRFFPGYEVPFKLVTDLGEIETYVTSARAGTPVGDPDAGTYIQAKLAEWYRRHPMIKVGDKVMFEVIEPMKRYRLSKV